MTGRSVPEWIGRTPDAKIPPRVRARIFTRENGICHLTGRKITPADHWDCDHKIALCNGGQHRESNLFPALKDPHRKKTKDDVAEKAKVAGIRNRHIGVTKPKGTIPSRPKAPKPVRDKLPMPSPKAMFQ